MIVEVNKERIEANLIIFDSVSFQAWAKKDGKLALNILADGIKKIIVEME